MDNIFKKISEKNYLELVYFDTKVLEKYFNDPKYIVFYNGYRGSISIRDEFYDESTRNEYIKNFGHAYSKSKEEYRVITAFASDLAKLPIKAQAYWYSYLLPDPNNYYPNSGFVKNLIKGEWVENISIFDALLMEIHFINEMCSSIGITKLYREEFDYNTVHIDDRPIDYHIVLLPTRDNYYKFINTLEKMVINNMQVETFLDNGTYIKGVNRKNEEGFNKGTIVLLNEWFMRNTNAQNIQEEIINPLKKLRKLRQKPAHQLYNNYYDEKIWLNQKELMHEVYYAVRNIRLLLANHPLSQTVGIPEILFEGTNIVQY